MNYFKIFLLCTFLLIKCASNPLSETLDAWKEKQNDDYWYGTAIISKKHFNGVNIHEAAHSQAISDIASQIKVSIRNDFKWIIEENNYDINDYSVQILDTKVDNNIENIEIVDFKDLNSSYVLFARLSKQKFYRSIQLKRESAVAIAKEYILKSKNPILTSFENLSNAEKAILPYIDYPIKINIDGSNINLYSYIQNLRNNLISRIKIEPIDNNMYIKRLVPNNNRVNIRVYDKVNSDPLSKIPLLINLNESSSNCFTNQNGDCVFVIDMESLSDDKNQYIKINLDREVLFGNSNYDFNADSQISIEILPTQIYLDIEEYNLGSKLEHNYIGPSIKRFLIENFNVDFVKDIKDSDISIQVYATTRKNGNKKNEYGLYQAYSDATLTVKNKNIHITDISINDVQGADFRAFKQAGHKSLDKISDKISNETLPRLVQILNSK